MPISGSQQAYKQARAGIARSGTTRSNYFVCNLVVMINGSDYSNAIEYGSLQITLVQNDEPDTARFSLKPGTTTPTNGQLITIGLGTATNLIFAGQIRSITHARTPGIDNTFINVEASDWTPLLDRRLIWTYYGGQSASFVAADIINNFTSGFTTRYIQTGLPSIDFFPLTAERPSGALRRLKNLMGGGGFYVDANREVHFFGTGGDLSGTAPLTINASQATTKAFAHSDDFSQVRNRICVIGQATSTSATVAFAQGSIPVDTIDIFDPFLSNQFLISEYGRFVGSGLTTGYAGTTTVNTSAAIGATSLRVDNYLDITAGLVSGNGWFRVGGDLYLYFTGGSATAAPVGDLTGIPSSGPGSIQRAIDVGEPVALIPVVHTASGFARQIDQGTPVALVVTVDDAASQATIAALEGGDGIHEFPVTDGRLGLSGATARGQAELTNFANPLTSATWRTLDLNALPGRPQAISFSIDSISTTLTITRVTLTFPVPNTRPFRDCEAHMVPLARFDDMSITENV